MSEVIPSSVVWTGGDAHELTKDEGLRLEALRLAIAVLLETGGDTIPTKARILGLAKSFAKYVTPDEEVAEDPADVEE